MRKLRARAIVAGAAVLCLSLSGCGPKQMPAKTKPENAPVSDVAKPKQAPAKERPRSIQISDITMVEGIKTVPEEDTLPEQAPVQKPLRIGVMGDSITNGLDYPDRYPESLEQQLQEQFPGSVVDSYGISGQTCTKMKKRFKDDILDKGYDKVVIQCGTNDLYIGFGVGRVKREITSMIETAKEAGIEVVLVTVGPLDGYKGWDANKEKRRVELNDWMLSYPGAIAADVARILSEGTPPALKKEFQYKDKLHPNGKGLDAMAEATAAAIENAATQ